MGNSYRFFDMLVGRVDGVVGRSTVYEVPAFAEIELHLAYE